jgi:DNA-directed RNA polymerase specialized sigma24 family protein
LFQNLTVQERQLIKWRFVDGKRSSEISAKINEHPNTVREHLYEIKKKLAKLIQEQDEQLAKELGVKDFLLASEKKKGKKKS